MTPQEYAKEKGWDPARVAALADDDDQRMVTESVARATVLWERDEQGARDLIDLAIHLQNHSDTKLERRRKRGVTRPPGWGTT